MKRILLSRILLFSVLISTGLSLGMVIDNFLANTIKFLPSNLTTVLTDITSLSEKIEKFKSTSGQYPKTYEKLVAVLKFPKPFPKEQHDGLYIVLPLEDSWGKKYRYRFPGIRNQDSFDLFSVGQDGQTDTSDDIGNWANSWDASYEPFFITKLLMELFRDPVYSFLFSWLVLLLGIRILQKNSFNQKVLLVSYIPSLFETLIMFCMICSSGFVFFQFFINLSDSPLSNMVHISGELERFRSEMGQYPHTHRELVNSLYGEHLPSKLRDKESYAGYYLLIPIKDPWGQEYRYLSPGIHHKDSFDLFSLGQDGRLGTPDDVNNWDESWKDRLIKKTIELFNKQINRGESIFMLMIICYAWCLTVFLWCMTIFIGLLERYYMSFRR